jgi:UPF0716 protein FxsA
VVLFVLFVLAPIAELYTIIRVGETIGFFATVGLILAVAAVGSWLVKREGLRVWARFNESIAEGRVPTREIVDGVLILAAGALLVTPGFLSDVLGVLLLFPPTRIVFRSYLMRRGASGRRIVVRGFGSSGRTRAPSNVVDTDATEPRGEL